ncbi:MAG: IS110 family RNA-guided transposase [Solirubrobacteraceae bacterium]
MRCIGLDVHQRFCVVAICEGGRARLAGRVETTGEQLELFAQSLVATDRVVLEATGAAFAIARILQPHVAEVVVANASEVRAISHARVKSDNFDARTLARLLWAGMLVSVWVPDEQIGALRRRVARRAALVRTCTRAKNEIHGALGGCLLGKAPVSDLFGVKGRAWLAEQPLAADEAETVCGCLAQIAFCDQQITQIDRQLAEFAVASADAKRLLTIPGVGVASAVTLIAAIGDITRFADPRKLVGYLGLDPKVRQSGDTPARAGKISKRGNAQARCVLVEAAWMAMRTPGPLRAFGQRVQARSGAQVAAVAVARKLAVLAWHLLTRGEDYAFARPSLVRKKLRDAELAAGAPPLGKRHNGQRVSSPAERAAEQQLAETAETAYKRISADWAASRPAKARAGATPGRASQRPSKGNAARQAQTPEPAL